MLLASRTLYRALGLAGLLISLGSLAHADETPGPLDNTFDKEAAVDVKEINIQLESEAADKTIIFKFISSGQTTVGPTPLIGLNWWYQGIARTVADSLRTNDIQWNLSQNGQSAAACGVKPSAPSSNTTLVIDDDQQTWTLSINNHFADTPENLALITKAASGTQPPAAVPTGNTIVFSGDTNDFDTIYPTVRDFHDAYLNAIASNTTAMTSLCTPPQPAPTDATATESPLTKSDANEAPAAVITVLPEPVAAPLAPPIEAPSEIRDSVTAADETAPEAVRPAVESEPAPELIAKPAQNVGGAHALAKIILAPMHKAQLLKAKHHNKGFKRSIIRLLKLAGPAT